MKKILLALLLLFPSFIMSQQAQATTVYGWEDSMSCFMPPCSTTGLNDYSAAVQGYNGITNGTSTFDGTFIQSGNSVLVTLNGLPTHDMVDIDFLLAIIDSWDGTTSTGPSNTAPDYFNVTIDGTSIYRETYSNFNPAFQSATTSNQLALGAFGFGRWDDSAYDMGVLSAFTGIAHTSSVLQVKFFANGAGWQGSDTNRSDESFGLEDIAINVYSSSPNAVDEPLGLGLLGLGLIGFSLARRKRK